MVTNRIAIPGGEVSLRLDGPADAEVLVTLAPGASGGMDSGFMSAFADGLAARGRRVARFNFLYQERGRKSPDRWSVLEDTFRSVLQDLHARHDGAVVIGGKSMGGRVASHLAAEGADVSGVVFLGYPLHPPGKPQGVRADHLPKIQVPMLFVEGARDPFCPLPTLERVLAERDIKAAIVVIDGGDHSFKVRASSGRSTEQAWEEAIEALDAWLGDAIEL